MHDFSVDAPANREATIQERTRHAPFRPWVYGFVICCTILALSPVFQYFAERGRQPVYAGKRIGEWFDQYCSTNSSASTKASDALTEMGSSAVPFLVATIRSSNMRQFEKRRDLPIVGRVFGDAALKQKLRYFKAASALALLKTNAISCVGDLADVWQHEPDPRTRAVLTFALGEILQWTNPPDARPQDLERLIIEEARRRAGSPVPLVLVGTNEIQIGTKLYNSFTKKHVTTVIGRTEEHDFGDGDLKPAFLLENREGNRVWVPPDSFTRALMQAPR